MPGRNHCQSVVWKGFARTKGCKSPAEKRTQIGGDGGGELNDKPILKTRKLLKIKKRETPERRRIEENWNVTGTRKFFRFIIALWYDCGRDGLV
jgi:hypothetical protein